MNPQELDTILRQTLADGKLSFPERSALLQRLGEARLDAQQTAAYRSQAFALARESVEDTRARAVIAWLEDIVKLLHPVKPGASAIQTTPAAVPPSSEVLFAPFD